MAGEVAQLIKVAFCDDGISVLNDIELFLNE